MARTLEAPRVGNARIAERLARQQGFEPVRQTGSHVTWEHRDGRRTTITRHPGDIRGGTWHAILKVLGLLALVAAVAAHLAGAW